MFINTFRSNEIVYRYFQVAPVISFGPIFASRFRYVENLKKLQKRVDFVLLIFFKPIFAVFF